MATTALRVVLAGLPLAGALSLRAAPREALVSAPECFRVLSAGTALCQRYRADRAPVPQAVTGHLQPTVEEARAGRLCGRVPMATPFQPDWVWNEPHPEARLSLFAMRGEYRAAVLGVYALREVTGLMVESSALEGPAGDAIPSSCVDVRVVHGIRLQRGERETWLSRFLVQPPALAVPPGTTCFLWVSVSVPAGQVPGLYQGELRLRAAPASVLAVPLRLRVLDLDFEYPRGAWGAYLPGHLQRPTADAYHNYAAEDWTEANLVPYFRFWRTRGLTSPSLFHVYPELACTDGHTAADFGEVRAVAEAMKRAGLPGPLCVDLRHTLWWANTAGRELAGRRAQGRELAGALGVAGPAGRLSSQYAPEALRLFSEAIVALLGTAQREQWPSILLLPEEECSHVDKAASYDASVATFKAAAGERTLLVDNVIGYGRAGEIDRGHRDGIAVREYNNWTDAGLAQARADGATVWTYNLGWSRAAILLYTLRTGASGYHQWADQWLHHEQPLEWLQTAVADDGVVTSTSMETFHEALCDLGYVQMLLDLAARLDAAGRGPEAAAARRVPATLVAAAPVQRYEFLAWASQFSDADLDCQRWRLVAAIGVARAALGLPAPTPASVGPASGPAGQPRLCAAVPRAAGLSGAPARTLPVVRTQEALTPDGRETERCWAAASRAGPLWWTATRERQLRAQAGSAEEFRRLHPPSYASARVAYGDAGLYLLVNANHATQENCRCTRADDDPELWADDCMEFFFQTPAEPASVYQLIINVRGARVLKRDRGPRPCGVRTGTVSPVNPSGGYAQEIVVPWRDFGLAGPPEAGTVWRFNVCREFHSYDQLTCWAQVEQEFGLADGAIVFEGPAAQVALRDLVLGYRYAGRNRLRGRAERLEADDPRPLRIELQDETGAVLAATALPSGADRFELDYDVPVVSQPRRWTLRVVRAGDVLTAMDVVIPAVTASVQTPAATVETFAGARLELPVTACVGDLDAAAHPLTGQIRDAAGTVFPLGAVPLRHAGPQRLWIDPDGLAVGPAVLTLWLEGLQARGLATIAVDVVAAPFGPVPR